MIIVDVISYLPNWTYSFNFLASNLKVFFSFDCYLIYKLKIKCYVTTILLMQTIFM